MSLFSFKYLWPRSVVHVDLTLFVYLWADPLHYACELSPFYLFIALAFIPFFFLFFFFGSTAFVRVGFSHFIHLWAREVCVWVFPLLFTCGLATFVSMSLSPFKYLWVRSVVRVGFSLFIYLWACGVVRVGFSLYKYLWARGVCARGFIPI
jgi:hypothetical protein